MKNNKKIKKLAVKNNKFNYNQDEIAAIFYTLKLRILYFYFFFGILINNLNNLR